MDEAQVTRAKDNDLVMQVHGHEGLDCAGEKVRDVQVLVMVAMVVI